MADIDIIEVRRWYEIFHPPGSVVELRVLGHKTWSMYCNNIETLLHGLSLVQPGSGGIYSPINEINTACYDREQKDKLLMSPKSTTSDKEIEGRNWILIDIDPERVSGTNATDDEKSFAYELMKTIGLFLQQQGFSSPVVADSSNGYHLYYKVEIANTDENTEIVKNILQVLDMYFSTEKVKVDITVYNAARISKIIGTRSNKGSDTKERPQRMSRFVKIPDDIETTDIAYLKKVANLLPKREAPSRMNNYNEQFDLHGFFSKYGIEIKKEASFKNGTKYILAHCPFDENHKAPDSAVFHMNDGSYGFKCLHNSCANRTWRDFRLHFDPQAYDQKSYREFKNQLAYEKPQKFEPKQESEQTGEKWFTMSSIPYVDVTKIFTMPTGFIELDKRIRGLMVGDVTVLSGLSGAGKSSWLDCVLLNLAERDIKTAIWSGELQPFRFQSWIDQIAAGPNHTTLYAGSTEHYYVDRFYSERIHKWLGDKILLYNNDYGNQWQQIFADIDIVVKRGYRLIVLDNLAALDISSEQSSVYEQQKSFINELRIYAKKNDVHVIVVAHPRKEMTFLRKESISGTADLTNLADNVFIIHRVGKDFTERGKLFLGDKIEDYTNFSCVIEVAKNRMFGVVDYLCGMYYDKKSRRLKNTEDECIAYGWEDKPEQLTMDACIKPNVVLYKEPEYEGDNAFTYYTQEELDQITPF